MMHGQCNVEGKADAMCSY